MSLSSTNTTPMRHADPLNCLQKIGNFLQSPTHSLVGKRGEQKNCLVKALLAVLIAVTSPLALLGIIFFKLGACCSPSLAGRSLSSDRSPPSSLSKQVLEQLHKYEEASRLFSTERPPANELEAMADALVTLMDRLPKTLPQTVNSTDIEIATTLLRDASLLGKTYRRFADSWNLADKLRDNEAFSRRVKKGIVQSFRDRGGYGRSRLETVNSWLESKKLNRIDV